MRRNHHDASRDNRGVKELSDGELLRLVAAANDAAFDELWDRHAPWLILRLRRRSPDDAADLLQETFLAAWRNAASFRGTDAGGWLWTIASRRLIDARRRAARTPVPADREPATVTVSSEEQVLGDVYDPRLEEALSQLSPKLVAALQATVVDGLSTREAALLLGVAEGTVKARTSRARSFLRARLAHPNRPVEEI